MKILYLITKSEAGGAQTHVADLCRYFKNQGNEISIMSRSGGWLEEESKKIGVSFITNNFFGNSANPFNIFRAIKKIKKYCDEFKPDILHCHSSAAAFFGRLAVRGKIRTIYTAHGWGFNIGMSPFIRCAVLIAEKITAKYTDKYICVSEFVKKLALKYHLAPVEKFVVIYNGVAPQAVLTDGNKNAGIRLMFVGRLAEPKKPELIIEAVSLLPSEIKNIVTVVIIGDGPKRHFLSDLAVHKDVMVDFKGVLAKNLVLEQISNSDIFVFVSAWEGFPYTILEAMSCGLPIIANDVGGVREAVNEQNGILVKNEVKPIQEAILRLINNKDLRFRLGGQGRKDVEKKFSLQKMLIEINNVYNKSL